MPTFRQQLKSWLNGDGWQHGLSALASHIDGSGVDHKILDRFRAINDGDVADGDVDCHVVGAAEWVNKLSPTKGAKAYFIQHHEVFSTSPSIAAKVRQDAAAQNRSCTVA